MSPDSNRQRSLESQSSAAVDTIFNALGDSFRRELLHILSEHPAEELTLDELAATIVDRTDRKDASTVEVLLVHSHLPVLSSAELIDYDGLDRVITQTTDDLASELLRIAAAAERDYHTS